MTDYKALYEQQLQKNEELEDRCESTALERDGALDDFDKLNEEVMVIHERVIHRDIENVEIKAQNKEMNELWEQDKKKVIELRKEIKYWKNFALFYWSGFQLGEEVNSDSDVWNEALDEINSNEDADREELTKKCMNAIDK